MRKVLALSCRCVRAVRAPNAGSGAGCSGAQAHKQGKKKSGGEKKKKGKKIFLRVFFVCLFCFALVLKLQVPLVSLVLEMSCFYSGSV